MKKSYLLTVCMTALVLLLAACGGKKDKEVDLSIGILQYVEHGSLDAAREGFIEELEKNGYVEGKNLKIDYQNAQADTANLKSMSERLVSDKNDVNLAIATPAAVALANEDSETPMVITAVTDAVDAKLVKDNDKPGGNVTGTIDLVPIEDQIKLLLSIKPDAKTVGLIYNTSETNSEIQAKLAEKELKAAGITVKTVTVTSSNDVQQALTSVLKEVDALYIPTDNIMAASMATVGQLAKEYQVPVIPGSTDMAKDGGLATYGIDYKKLGQQTARMALRITEDGENPSEMSIEKSEILELVVNEEMAKALGIDPASIKIDE
ncbi:ABC transporter substrate-binding protein [Isobaculum melis]|uniref:Putative ABC transport system substrate-binding protein n=1 Tax=Isobaculum melis TaxID=142588 RepID=A0A1H9RTT1_9LACT|nr:ABC transporter substrate-binding protein [Isobaculum melis]SER76047.1 putative ABC transport system substrate-binding protein [Isobaculum melis]